MLLVDLREICGTRARTAFADALGNFTNTSVHWCSDGGVHGANSSTETVLRIVEPSAFAGIAARTRKVCKNGTEIRALKQLGACEARTGSEQ
jgi:hypothetical protein